MAAACPYCLTELEIGVDPIVSCPDCATPTHQECWDENGGCTVFGCAQAPSDEPKLIVAAGDLERATTVAATSAVEAAGTTLHEVVSPSPPPPPFPDGYIPPPPFPGAVPPYNGARAVSAVVGHESAPMSVGGALSITAPAWDSATHFYSPPTSRAGFVLLGIFLGVFGAHNFFAGYLKRGVIQLLCTCFSGFTLAAVIWLWAIVEVCVVSRDADDLPMS